MLGDVSPGLVRAGDIEPELDDELWLLTHPDIRSSDRIYAFMTHCVETIRKNRGLIEGFCGSASGAARFADFGRLSSMSLVAAQPRREYGRASCRGRGGQ